MFGLILISGCSTTSKYTANDFVYAASINLDGVNPRVFNTDTYKQISWNISNSLVDVSIYIEKDSATASKNKQELIDTWNASTFFEGNISEKTISGQKITILKKENINPTFPFKTSNVYIWTKDNFGFMITEWFNIPTPHLDELATRIIGVYNK